jgi:hypothetical protein
MPDHDDIPLAKVGWQPSHSAPWLREILADDRKNRKPPHLQFHHHIGRKSLWTGQYGALRAEFIAIERGAPPRARRHRRRHWHINGTLQVGEIAAASASTELYYRGGVTLTPETYRQAARRRRAGQSRPRKRECL